MTYPEVARAGLDTPWQVTVEHVGGFEKELTIAVTGSYFGRRRSRGARGGKISFFITSHESGAPTTSEIG